MSNVNWIDGEYRSLTARDLTEAACRKFGYKVGQYSDGRACQIADYRDSSGNLVGQKVRFADKTFTMLKDSDTKLPLYGQHLWKPGGRRLVITEGEIDAISVAMAFGLSWACVSVPNGADGAVKAVQANLEFVESFDMVVFCFDMDEPGRKAAAACAALLSPGRASIAEMPRKDANEMLVAGEVKALMTCIYEARAFRPGGIVNGRELWQKITERQDAGMPYPWPGLTKKTGGRRTGTLTVWTAGTGIGKSTILRQIAYETAFPPEGERVDVGCVMLEESVGRSAQGFLSHRLGKLTHIPGNATDEELRQAFDDTLAHGNVWFHDHFGSLDGGDLIGKMRYLAKGAGCKMIVLDHISIVVSGMSLSDDERRTIDRVMTDLRSLVEETQVELHVISHLKRVGNESHEEGGKVSLSHLRGSQSIAQLSDFVIGVERNNQDESGTMNVKVLKNRVTGETGAACSLGYDKDTGRLFEIETPGAFDGADDDDLPF